MVLVAFLQAQNCSNYPASWRHPDAATDFLSAAYYQRIARTLEAGKFHLAFFDDRLAMPSSLRRELRADGAVRNPRGQARRGDRPHDDGLRHRAARPGRDLLDDLLRTVSRRAHVRARSTHSSADGRRGTSSRRSTTPRRRTSAAPSTSPHDLRYDRAEEFMEIVTGHWDAWDARRARTRQGDGGVFADPAKVHRLDYNGDVLALARSVHGAALAAGPSGHHPGRPERPRPRVRRPLGGADLRHPADLARPRCAATRDGQGRGRPAPDAIPRRCRSRRPIYVVAAPTRTEAEERSWPRSRRSRGPRTRSNCSLKC